MAGDQEGRIGGVVGGYAEEERPLGGYTLLSSIFAVSFAGALVAAYRQRGELPGGYGAWDLLLVAAATQKVSRLIGKDKVTSFARAPFTRYQEPAGHGEVSEEPRGSGVRMAIGELLICPYCLSQWVVAAFAVGMVAAPRLTRLLAFMFSAQTAADFLQLGYLAAEEAGSS